MFIPDPRKSANLPGSYQVGFMRRVINKVIRITGIEKNSDYSVTVTIHGIQSLSPGQIERIIINAFSDPK